MTCPLWHFGCICSLRWFAWSLSISVSLALPTDTKYAAIVWRVAGVQPCISFSNCSWSLSAFSFAWITAFYFASFASISAFYFAASSSYSQTCFVSLESNSLFSSLYFWRLSRFYFSFWFSVDWVSIVCLSSRFYCCRADICWLCVSSFFSKSMILALISEICTC